MRFSDLCRVDWWEEEGVVRLGVRVGGMVGFRAWLDGGVVVGPRPREKGVMFVWLSFWAWECRVGWMEDVYCCTPAWGLHKLDMEWKFEMVTRNQDAMGGGRNPRTWLKRLMCFCLDT